MLEYYWRAFGPLDRLIWLVGIFLAVLHIVGLAYFIYRHWWRLAPTPRSEGFRIILLSFTELLPLLGLLGTVIALLNTFYVFGGYGGDQVPELGQMVLTFAPALTTTVSGLIWAVLNIAFNAAWNLLEWCYGAGTQPRQG